MHKYWQLIKSFIGLNSPTGGQGAALMTSYSNNRVHPCSLQSRNEARKYTDENANTDCHKHIAGRDKNGKVQKGGYNFCEHEYKQQTYHTTNNTEKGRFKKKLGKYHTFFSAYGFF